MATFYSSNFQNARISRPNDKFKAGELTGKSRYLVGRLTVPAALSIGDTIELGDIPANSRIVSAKILINKSLGATGIISIGHGATVDENGNTVALANAGVCAAADAGGQAALSVSGVAQVIILNKLAQATRVYGYVSEATNGTVSDAEAIFLVEFVND
jgi:hypothetical protein